MDRPLVPLNKFDGFQSNDTRQGREYSGRAPTDHEES